MADNCCKCSHAGFYVCMALLAVAIAGSGYWWFTTNDINAQKEATSQANPPTHPKPKVPAQSPAADATTNITDSK